MEISSAVTALSALAQTSRLAAFRCLVQAGSAGLAAGALSEQLGIPPATLSFHLKELSRAGLIHAQTSGRFVIYSADYAAMSALLAYLTENCCAGDPSQCSPSSPC